MLSESANLEVAVALLAVELHIGGVDRGYLETVSEPGDGSPGVGLHLAADIGRVSLPRVHRHHSENFRRVCKR